MPSEPTSPTAAKADDTVSVSRTFAELSLPESLLQATTDQGFDTCTEIQALTLPHIASGHDIAAQAQTGTGKTAAFLLGAFTRLLAHDGGKRDQNQPRMLVIAPTRELAIQIKKDADSLGAHTGLTSAVVYGGVDYDKQRRQLADGVDIVIGTPGRLIDYFKQKVFNLKRIEIAVLDEADRMFDLGFISDIRFLLRRMPEPAERQSMLFSATLSHRVMELAYEHMNNPLQIKTESQGVTAEGVNQQLFHPASDEKVPLLLGLLGSMQPSRSIIFVNTKRAAEYVEGYLVGNDIACGTLSGDVRQKKRQRILEQFTAGELPVLIATDVAARGLHIDDVSHVFNYDLPQQAEDYVHRIGRTARAGTQGEAVSFACEEYSFSLPEIEEYIGQTVPMSPITDELLLKPRPRVRIERDRPDRDGKRSSGDKRNRGRASSDQKRSNSRQKSGKRFNETPRPGNGSDLSRPQNQSSTNNGTEAVPNAHNTPKKSADGSAPAATDSDTGAKKRRRRRRSRKPKPNDSVNTPNSSDGS